MFCSHAFIDIIQAACVGIDNCNLLNFKPELRSLYDAAVQVALDYLKWWPTRVNLPVCMAGLRLYFTSQSGAARFN